LSDVEDVHFVFDQHCLVGFL